MVLGKFQIKRYLFLFVFLGACLLCWGQAVAAPVKNLIVLIMDGCGDEQITLARWFKGGPLALDAIRTGAVQSFIADSVIADSAPAASAYAAGVRTGDKIIGLWPRSTTIPGGAAPKAELALKPCATVLEGARLLGKSTGIVVTSRFSHATPAAYFAHVPNRDQEEDIAIQAVHQNLDVVFGGGRKLLFPGQAGGSRRDQQDLAAVLKERGYQLIDHAAALPQLSHPKVFGLFAASHLEPEIDRQEAAPEQPSLAEMTQKAIEVLSNNPAGFFLMVEGSQIDWACHANDPAHLLGDLLVYDQAVQVALDFAKKDGQTLVLALPDHNTGGLSIGNRRSDHTYPQLQPQALIAPLKNMQLSASALWRRLGEDKTPENIQAAVQKYWGINLSSKDAQEILELSRQYGKEGHYALGEVISLKYTYLGWTTHGHTGGDIPLYAFGPHRPVGLLDAPEIGRICARTLGLDLEKLTDRLFAEARQFFPKDAVQLDRANPKNPAVRISYQERQAELPVNTNILNLDGRQVDLEGIVVYIPETDKIYIPLQAVHLLKGESKALPAFAK